MASGRLSRAGRLTRAADIQAVFQRGKRVGRGSVLLMWRRAEGAPRAAFVVSRQVRGAVRRNRARRRVREAYRATRQTLPQGVEVVIMARPPAGDGPYREILRDVEAALLTVARQYREAADT